MLEMKGIYKSFGDTEVLKGVDVSVEEGDIVGIIGSSGSGKSTLLRCINFLEHADAGQMELDGVSFDVKNPGKQNILYMRRNTAMVFQQFNLFKEKNARENVMMGLTHVQNKSKEEAAKIADDLLDKVGLSERKEFFPSQLSGRAAQKVAEKLAQLACHKQVLCVTHLPQLAAMAGTHFLVEKGEQNGRTFTKVVELDREARKAEIARITGGSQVTDALLASAADILDQATAYRAQLRER